MAFWNDRGEVVGVKVFGVKVGVVCFVCVLRWLCVCDVCCCVVGWGVVFCVYVYTRGVVWCGVHMWCYVWCGVVWCGVHMWCGVVGCVYTCGVMCGVGFARVCVCVRGVGGGTLKKRGKTPMC